jgi:phosphate acetyltransferase
MGFIEKIKACAKANLKTIVLPEANDIRTIEACSKILKEGLAKIILIGKKDEIIKKAGSFDISGATVIDPESSEYYESFSNKFFEMRKAKGIDLEKAKQSMLNPLFFGVMLVNEGICDGMVAGACNATGDVLRPALQILKTAPNTKLVSSFFIMCVPDCELGENGVFLFSDCGLVENPSAEDLSDIAISSAKSFKQLTLAEPVVAMLSYSTYGSAKSELVTKVTDATKMAKQKAPELALDGELQLDAAIIPEIGKSKAPDSLVAGKANVLIFPDLNAGNIGYKLVQRLAKAEAYGPITQGIKKPVNDLSRGCNADDIVGVVAITAVQSI